VAIDVDGHTEVFKSRSQAPLLRPMAIAGDVMKFAFDVVSLCVYFGIGKLCSQYNVGFLLTFFTVNFFTIYVFKC